MRKATLSSDEIFEAEKAAAERKEKRAGGYKLMHDRDAGSHKLSNGVEMRWPAPDEVIPLGDNVWVGEGKRRTKVTSLRIPNRIPPGSFALVIDKKTIIFNTEEFRRWLRWA